MTDSKTTPNLSTAKQFETTTYGVGPQGCGDWREASESMIGETIEYICGTSLEADEMGKPQTTLPRDIWHIKEYVEQLWMIIDWM